MPALCTAMILMSLSLPPAQTLPWQLRLGEASLHLRRSVTVVDQIVIVPDVATLADEIARWSPSRQWPVLIDDPDTPLDDFRAAMFVRRFAPSTVLRRPSTGSWPTDTSARRVRIKAAAAAAWDAVPGQRVSAAAHASGLRVPPSLVISSSADPASTAAMILSAGRGQDIAWIDGDFGRGGSTLSASKTQVLIQRIEQAAAATGRRWQTLGDGLDALTVCRTLAARCTTSAPLPQPDAAGKPVAITDVIGRHTNGARWAVTGWIFGSSSRSTWSAMCSLFLPHDTAWLCETYPDTDQWKPWTLSGAARQLRSSGFEVAMLQNTTLRQIETLAPDGLDADLGLMNSKGNQDFFQMHEGLNADPGDVPVLNVPMALSLVHSWSLKDPTSIGTVGGRWLDHGVYAMVGSSREPMLNAFVPPALFVQRMLRGVPMLVAARWWPGDNSPMSRTWRVNTIGDPLMVVPPTGEMPRKRTMPTESADSVTVETQAIDTMRAVEEAHTDANYAAALRNLVMMGRDEVAAGLWENAAANHAIGPASARAAYGALFRTGRREPLVDAWNRLSTRTTLDADMLWRSLAARIGPGMSDAAIDALQQAIKPDSAATRWAMLAPEMARRWGIARAQRGVQQSMSSTSRRQKTALQAVLKSL